MGINKKSISRISKQLKEKAVASAEELFKKNSTAFVAVSFDPSTSQVLVIKESSLDEERAWEDHTMAIPVTDNASCKRVNYRKDPTDSRKLVVVQDAGLMVVMVPRFQTTLHTRLLKPKRSLRFEQEHSQQTIMSRPGLTSSRLLSIQAN